MFIFFYLLYICLKLICIRVNSLCRPTAYRTSSNQLCSSKVFIQRDYSSGTICKFQTKFPSELESRIDEQQFEETIQTLNNLYAEAEKLGGKSYLEGCLASLTAYTIFLCMETHYEKVKQKKGSHQSLMLWVTVPQIIVELLLKHIIFGSKLCVSRRDNVYTCI
uniref:Golgin subfamily A member 7 n=1 Tax=Haplochromis burtoni TaxID=8153 RepID=A0A3Q2V7N8_HAPBU